MTDIQHPARFKSSSILSAGGLLARLRDLLSLQFDMRSAEPGKKLILLAFFFASYALVLQFSGVSIGRWGVDAAQHEYAIANDGRGATSLADQMVASLLPHMGIGSYYGTIPTIAFVIMVSVLCVRARWTDIAMVVFLVLPTIFQFKFASKEIIINLCWFLVFIVFQIASSSRVRFVFSFLMMVTLGLTFRKYYIITAAIYVVVFLAASLPVAVGRVLAVMAAVSFIPPISRQLLMTKYMIFRNVSAAAASKIPLAMSGFSGFALIANYLISLLYFLLPVLLGPRVQVVYMQIFSAVIVASSYRAIRRGEKCSASLFVAIVLTLPLFVSEVGTYARHVGAALPLLLMSLGLGSKQKHK